MLRIELEGCASPGPLNSAEVKSFEDVTNLAHPRGDLRQEKFLLCLFIDPEINGFEERAYGCCCSEDFHGLRQ